jgi:hypothetical protein
MKHKLLSRIDALERAEMKKTGWTVRLVFIGSDRPPEYILRKRSTGEKSVSQRTTQLTSGE